jgi:haloalkane dehalogenase
MTANISADFPYAMKRVSVGDADMAYVDVGQGDPIVFLHGNPTSSYLWRNVIPHLSSIGRCLAPDLIGMGQSGKSPRGAYRFTDHIAYLDAWFDKLDLRRNVVLVVHDWGAALGFQRACRFPDQIQGLAYMEAMVRPRKMTDLPEDRRPLFQKMRSADGEPMILDAHFFVEKMLFEGGVVRKLTDQEKDAYRAPYPTRESRMPQLIWPREIPFDGEPADCHAIVQRYSDFLAASANLPKLFINAELGHALTGEAREFCRKWPNQREISFPGKHYLQEDFPHEIGAALADFVRGIRGGKKA